MPMESSVEKMTTRRWELSLDWKDGATDWVTSNDLKVSYPVELAICATNRKIQDEPIFAWWVPFVLKKRRQIMQKIKSNNWSRTNKYGIRPLTSTGYVYRRIFKNRWMEIDKEYGSAL